MFDQLKNIKQMTNLVKQVKTNMKEIDAERVVIELKDKNIVIEKPKVIYMDMMTQPSYQVMGQAKEEEKNEPTEDDIKMIMEKTGKDRETVEKKLEELNNDLAATILELKKGD